MIDASRVKELGLDFGVDVLRITRANAFPTAYKHHLEQINAGLYTKREHRHLKNLENFYNPEQLVPGARSIIAAAQCYLTDEILDDSQPGKPHGLIARYTWRNHYQDLRERLNKIAESLPDHKWFCSLNGPIAEKPIAQQSGVGFFGKHSIIINPKFGSWIVLGAIITTLELEPDPPLENDCGHCQICIQCCPTKAIIKPYFIDRNRCIQELTNWPGIIPDDIARAWGSRLYGCTTCQEICPINTRVRHQPPRTDIGQVGASFPVIDILHMNEEEYRRQFANNQMSANWINFNAIQRNALLVLGNSHDETTLPTIENFTKNPDPLLSHTARWALNQFI